MDKRNKIAKIKIILLLIAYALVVHTSYAFKEITIEVFDIRIAIGFVFVNVAVLIVSRLLYFYDNSFKIIRYIAVWLVAGSISNLVDEIMKINTEKQNYETFVFVALFLILLKTERKFIKNGK